MSMHVCARQCAYSFGLCCVCTRVAGFVSEYERTVGGIVLSPFRLFVYRTPVCAYYVCLCLCFCVCACVRACVRVRALAVDPKIGQTRRSLSALAVCTACLQLPSLPPPQPPSPPTSPPPPPPPAHTRASATARRSIKHSLISVIWGAGVRRQREKGDAAPLRSLRREAVLLPGCSLRATLFCSCAHWERSSWGKCANYKATGSRQSWECKRGQKSKLRTLGDNPHFVTQQ